MKHLSSRELFNNLIQEKKFKKYLLAVRLAMRKWAFSEYEESIRCELTPGEHKLVWENPDFLAYVKQKMDILAGSPDHIFIKFCWHIEEERGNRVVLGGRFPWFLCLPESELAKRREAIEEEQRDQTFLTSGISEGPG